MKNKSPYFRLTPVGIVFRSLGASPAMSDKDFATTASLARKIISELAQATRGGALMEKKRGFLEFIDF